MQLGTFIAKPYVRPKLVGWSRWLAGGVMALFSGAIIVAGFAAIAQGIMHHFWLVLLLLISLFVVAALLIVPLVLPTDAPSATK